MAHGRLTKRLDAVLAFAALLAIAAPSWGRIFTFSPLDEVIYDRLPEPAREAYDACLEALDRIHYDVAVEHVQEAVAAAPDSMELRFFAANLTRYRAETTFSVQSARYFDQSIEHVNAILAMPGLSQRDRGRAEYLQKYLDQQRKTIEERDAKRRTFGMEVAKAYAKEVYTGDEGSAEIKAFREAISKLTTPGSASARATAAAAQALTKTLGEESAAPAGETLEMQDGDMKAGEGAPSEGGAAMEEPPPPAASSALLGKSPFVQALEGAREQLPPDGEDYASAKAFVDEFFPAVLTDWSYDAFSERLDPKFVEGLPELPGGGDKEAIARGLFSMLQGVLGSMKSFDGTTGELFAVETLNGRALAGGFQGQVAFEKGSTPIYIEVIKRVAEGATEWKVRDFNFDFEQVNAISGGQLQMLMGAMQGGGAGALGGGGAAPAANPFR